MLSLLVDGNNAAFRCNSVVELTTKSGQRTSAIYGVLNLLQHEIKNVGGQLDQEVGEVVVFWDGGHHQRRRELHPDYKGKRTHARTEEEETRYREFLEQTNILYEFLPNIGCKTLRMKGQEADDLIHAYIEMARVVREDTENKFVIVSTDEDFLQLLSEDVNVWSPIKKIMYDLPTFEERFGFSPESFLDYKILKGDSSDNIKGIPGIGDKTAANLIKSYGNLSNLLQHKMELMRSKITSRIFTQEGLQTLDLNNRLISLKEFVDLTETRNEIEDLVYQQPSVASKTAQAFLMKYQLSSLLVKYQEWIKTFSTVNSQYYAE